MPCVQQDFHVKEQSSKAFINSHESMLKSSMKPKKLKIAAVPKENAFEITRSADGKILPAGGPEAKLLEMILQVLNVEFEIVIAPDLDWGRKRRFGNWTGIIGMLGRNEADFAVNEIAVTLDRAEVVDFSPVYLSSPVTFFTRAPAAKDQLFVYTYPFQSTVWITILVMIIIFVAIFKLFLNNEDGSNKKYHLVQLISYLYGYLVNQGCSQRFKNISVRLFLICWMFFGMTLMFSYVAVLLSIMMSPLKEPALTTVQDLRLAVAEGTYSCGVLAGTYYHDIFLNTKEGVIGELGRDMKEKGNFLRKDVKAILDIIRKSNFAFIDAKQYASFYLAANQADDFFISEDFFLIAHGAVAMRKKLSQKKIINKVVQRVNQAGLYAKLLADTLFQIQLKTPRRHKKIKQRTLTIYDVKGAFLILSLGYATSFAVFFLEFFCKKFSYIICS